MKRRDLERKLRIAGCYLKREGGSRALWVNPKTGVTEAVPRHVEIKEPLASLTQSAFITSVFLHKTPVELGIRKACEENIVWSDKWSSRYKQRETSLTMTYR